jgi:hypothetical protein
MFIGRRSWGLSREQVQSKRQQAPTPAPWKLANLRTTLRDTAEPHWPTGACMLQSTRKSRVQFWLPTSRRRYCPRIIRTEETMRFSRFAGLILAVFFAGCGSCGRGPNPNDAGVEPCTQGGVACADGTECCSGHCANGNGAPDSGVCGNPLPGSTNSTCTPTGATCSTPAECCAGACEADGTGSTRCTTANACMVDSQGCQTARDCCSLNCSGATCGTFSVASLCKTIGQGCAGDDAACCSGYCAANNTCQKASGAASCGVAGEVCTSAGASSSCCSKLCVDLDPGAGTTLRCSASGACRSEGESCRDPDECCSFTCTSGFCGKPPVGGQCLVVGSACTTRSDCCSGLCAADATGFKACQYLGGCRPEEELCRQDTDCCGFYSSSKGTQPVCEKFGSDGVGRCRSLSGDAPAGEVCEESRGNTCSPKNDGYCLTTNVGIKRCAGQCGTTACTQSNCIANGTTCASASDCCSGICAPSANGFVCSATCLAGGSTCSTHSDCCTGFCNLAGVCDGIIEAGGDAGTGGGSTCTSGASCGATPCAPGAFCNAGCCVTIN